MQNWDFFGTKFGLWSHLGPSPKFGTSLKRLDMADRANSRVILPPMAYIDGKSEIITPLAH